MPVVTLNARTVPGLSCPPGKAEITYWSKDLPRFGLRCRQTGARSWIVLDNQNSRVPLGDARTLTFAEAFKEARKWLAKIALGQDPRPPRRRKEKSAFTTNDLVGHYLAHQRPRMKPRSYEELRRHLESHAVPLHHRPAAEVTQRNIVVLLQAIADWAPVTANRVRASLSAMFAWGMKAALVKSNPVAATFKPTEERNRENLLSDAQLAGVWACTTDNSDYSRIVRILLLCGARREEVAGIGSSEITRYSDGSATWVLPGERSKNGLPNKLFLPPMIAGLLPAPRDTDIAARDLLFGAGEGSFSGWSKGKRRLDEALATAGYRMPHWVS